MEKLNMKEIRDKKPFRQLYADEHEETFQTLLRDPLLLAVFILCSIRARRVKKLSPEGLGQFEFWLSELEYEKFGLKSTEKGRITRRLAFLIRHKLILKTGRKTGNKGSNVYAFNSDEIIYINPETESNLEKKQGTNSERTVTNKNVKNDKNVEYTSPRAVGNKSFRETGKIEAGFNPVGNSLEPTIVFNKDSSANKWQDHALRVANFLKNTQPSTSWFKLFREAHTEGRQVLLDSAATFCSDAQNVRDIEKLFFWKFYEYIKGKEGGSDD